MRARFTKRLRAVWKQAMKKGSSEAPAETAEPDQGADAAAGGADAAAGGAGAPGGGGAEVVLPAASPTLKRLPSDTVAAFTLEDEQIAFAKTMVDKNNDGKLDPDEKRRASDIALIALQQRTEEGEPKYGGVLGELLKQVSKINQDESVERRTSFDFTSDEPVKLDAVFDYLIQTASDQQVQANIMEKGLLAELLKSSAEAVARADGRDSFGDLNEQRSKAGEQFGGRITFSDLSDPKSFDAAKDLALFLTGPEAVQVQQEIGARYSSTEGGSSLGGSEADAAGGPSDQGTGDKEDDFPPTHGR